MRKLLCADGYRMYAKKWFWLCVVCMILLAVAFCMMQYTAMDYVVSLDRVIFLPLSVYGIAVAALVSQFSGEDFHSGVIRNKIIAGRSRASIYLSGMVSNVTACIVVYLLTIAVSLGIGRLLFPVNVTTGEIVWHLVLGLFLCLSYASLYHMIAMLTGKKTTAIVLCMGLSFLLLFLCLHTNQILMQEAFKDGLPNPHYVQGVKRTVYEWLHDWNPFGQAAQLSAMQCRNPARFVASDLGMAVLTSAIGIAGFGRKEIL